MRRWAAPSALALALTLSIASGAAAQTQAGWRYWTPADGIQESHSRKIGALPGGGVSIRHGQVKRVDVLDGYTVETIPEPRNRTEIETLMAGVNAAADGDPWVVSEGVLKQLSGGQWIVRARPRAGEEMRGAVPIDRARIVVLFDTRVAVLDPTRDTWTTLIDADAAGLGRFGTLVRGFSGELWIAAAGLIAAGSKSQVTTNIPTSFETMRIIKR